MIRCSWLLALAATAAMAGSALAGGGVDTTVTWVGGDGEWYIGDVWQGEGRGAPEAAQDIFGQNRGWFANPAGTDPVPDTTGVVDKNVAIVIDDGSTVFYDGGTVGDWRFRNEGDANGGTVTISGGSRLEVQSSIFGDPDGMWSQFDARELTITGAGSTLNRTHTVQNGGAFVLGSWRSEDGQTIDINVMDRGTFSNQGQVWFGAWNDSAVIDVSINLGEGARFSNKGALENGVSLDDTSGEEGEIAYIYNFDDNTGLPQDNDYDINFMGHGASVTVGEEGILVARETAQGDTWENTKMTYQELHDDGLLTVDGGAAPGAFGDSFFVSGSSGSPDYRIADIRGATDGGAQVGDINGDMRRDGADAGVLVANFGATGADAVLANGDILNDDQIDGADAGRIIAGFNSDLDDSQGGTGASAGKVLYDARTGRVRVAVGNVSNWWIDAVSVAENGVESPGMTGPDDVNNVLPGAGGLVTSSDGRVGELDFGGSFSYALELGQIAAAGIAEGDITLWYNGGGQGQQDLVRGELFYIPVVPEPTSVALFGIGLIGLFGSRRRLVG